MNPSTKSLNHRLLRSISDKLREKNLITKFLLRCHVNVFVTFLFCFSRLIFFTQRAISIEQCPTSIPKLDFSFPVLYLIITFCCFYANYRGFVTQ